MRSEEPRFAMSVTLPSTAPTSLAQSHELDDSSASEQSASTQSNRTHLRSIRLVGGLVAAAALAGMAYVAVTHSGLLDLGTSPTSSTGNDSTFQPVTRARLPVVVDALGDLESSKNVDVASEVEGSVMILSILQQGTPVKKGEVVCQLDSSTLRDTATNQKITVDQAETAWKQAVKTREVAEASVNEYLRATYPSSEDSMLSDLNVAKTQLNNSKFTIDWSDRMLDLGFATPSQNRADHLTYQRNELTLQTADTNLNVLRKYTRLKELTRLEAAVDSARSSELSSEAVYRLQLSKLEKYKRQIESCTLKAPSDGIVTYANEQQSRRGPMSQNSSLIEEGASVRERQPIFRLPDIKQMRIAARIQEAVITKLRAGQSARIAVDALPGQFFRGTVQLVRPLVDSRMAAENDVRIYTADISIDNPTDTLRPGMTGKVEILVDQSEDVLAVPVASVLQFDGKSYVYVAGPKSVERREVELGTPNERLIIVKSGVTEGELVARDPKAFMSEEEKARRFIVDAIDQSRNDDWDAILARSTSPGQTSGD
jgi:RND family efflux transporter MFP subunit